MIKRIVATGLFLATLTTTAMPDDRATIIALENAGAIVNRDDSHKERPVVLVTYFLRQVTPEGLKALKDLEELPAVEFVGTGDTELTSATLRAIQGKRTLKRLSIAFAKISDESAAILGTMKTLDSLHLQKQIEMSPRGVDEIVKLSNLKELSLSGRLVNDQTLESVSAFQNLKTLTIESVFVTDQGLRSLRRLRNLRTLHIFLGSSVTEEGMRQLAEMNLTHLEITLLEVTNGKLKEVRRLSSLTALKMVSAVKVTDAGIPFLVELTGLKELELSDASLTNAGIKELKSSLPKCKIVYDNRKRD